jgi:hypothetical protein
LAIRADIYWNDGKVNEALNDMKQVCDIEPSSDNLCQYDFYFIYFISFFTYFILLYFIILFNNKLNNRWGEFHLYNGVRLRNLEELTKASELFQRAIQAQAKYYKMDLTRVESPETIPIMKTILAYVESK